jgi:hypothetical protein
MTSKITTTGDKIGFEQQEELFNQRWIKGFERFLNVWPSHLIEGDDQGHFRFRLTRLEKERLQSLSLSNLFPTTWSTSGPQPSALGRCRKSLTELY